MHERYAQLAFTLCETVLATLYITSLLKLLRSKSTVHQRRVMWDLIYVNILCITFDSITIVLVYLNRTALNHPIQNFTYMLKFRLEFVVLNQLMSVAARGVCRETMAERRYHRTSLEDSRVGSQSNKPSTQQSEQATVTSRENPATRSTQIAMPPAALIRGSESSEKQRDRQDGIDQVTHHSGDEKVDDAFDHIASNAIPGEGDASAQTTTSGPKKGLSDNSFYRSGSDSSNDHAQLLKNSHGGSKWRKLRTLRTRHLHRNDEDDDDEADEIGLHMWENNGKLVLDVPWFKSGVGV